MTKTNDGYVGPERRSEDRVIATLAIIDNKIDAITEDVSELSKSVNGNDGSPGLRIKVDRLEQRAKRQDWTIGATVTAMLGVVVTWLQGIFHSG